MRQDHQLNRSTQPDRRGQVQPGPISPIGAAEIAQVEQSLSADIAALAGDLAALNAALASAIAGIEASLAALDARVATLEE